MPRGAGWIWPGTVGALPWAIWTNYCGQVNETHAAKSWRSTPYDAVMLTGALPA